LGNLTSEEYLEEGSGTNSPRSGVGRSTSGPSAPPARIAGRSVIVTDDGIATDSTRIAAL
jgi:hypothetical protein